MNPIGSYIIIKIEKILSIKNDLTTTCKEALTAPPSPPAIAVIIIKRLEGIIKPYKIGSVTPAKIPVTVTEPAKLSSLAFLLLIKLYKNAPKATPI
ncbi:hypothetical protein [Lactobacillus sp. ESL0233]|uniref:hypothetical protein n=1 Tax=Lactobacillus sp. ESL0233 TaxID=2069354 RepID=UPI001314E083|nr:hypothetical protein [Lactobacillus sp. ESL0233]